MAFIAYPALFGSRTNKIKIPVFPFIWFGFVIGKDEF